MALASLIVKIGADLTDLNKALDSTDKGVQRFGRKLQGVGEKMTLGLTLPIVTGLGFAFKASEEAAEGMAKLGAVLIATGGEAGVTADHVQKLAAQIQKTTTFEDDLVVSASAVLLTFKSVRNEVGEGNNVFDRTIVAATDMAAIFGGDLQQSTIQLAKAIEDPIRGMGALTRVGVTFDDQQRKMIETLQKSGDKLGAQRVVLEALEGQFGGTAAALAGTAGGQMTQAMNDLGDAAESVGTIITPVISKAAAAVKFLATQFSALSPPAQTVIVVASGLVAALGPVLMATALWMKYLPALRLALVALGGATGIGLVIGAITALAFIWVKWGDDIKRINGVIDQSVRTLISGVIDWFGRLAAPFDNVVAGVERVSGAFKGMWDKVVGHSYVPDMVSGVISEFKTMGDKTVESSLTLTEKVTADFERMHGLTVDNAEDLRESVVYSFLTMAGQTETSTRQMVEGVAADFARLGQVASEVTVGISTRFNGLVVGLDENAASVVIANNELRDEFLRTGGTVEKVATRSIQATDTMAIRLHSTFDRIGGWLGGLSDRFDGFVNNMISRSGAFGDAIGSIGQILGIAGPGGMVAGLAMSALGPLVNKAMEKAQKLLGDIAGRIANFLGFGGSRAEKEQKQLILRGELRAERDQLQAARDAAAKSFDSSTDSKVREEIMAMIQSLDGAITAITRQAGKIGGFATGGFHTGGLRIVGERGPELEATGAARIFNAQQTHRMLSGGSDDLIRAEIRVLQDGFTKMLQRLDRIAETQETGFRRMAWAGA